MKLRDSLIVLLAASTCSFAAVTSLSRQRPGLKVPDEDLPDKYFGIADYNGDNWISFKEAQASLGIDRDAFAVYDQDRDGRIDPPEFRQRYTAIIERGGAYSPPIPKAAVKRAARRTPEELLLAYDKNGDQALEAKELARALDDYGVANLAPQVATDKLDQDQSHKLELSELAGLAEVLSPPTESAHAPRAKSIAELFGRRELREIRIGSTPVPPRMPGPVSDFRRLDYDGDGRIELEDLIELQRPIQLPVRVQPVLAALDTDRDGTLSPEEFSSSMSPGAH